MKIAEESKSNFSVQKQVKQKILQAQQEEALLVQTSAALQNKMEKVEQQLGTSMNGYHIGHHVRNGSYGGQKATVQPPKCPMAVVEVKPPQCPVEVTSEVTQVSKTVKEDVKKKENDNEIASSYFQAKFGSEVDVSQTNGNFR